MKPPWLAELYRQWMTARGNDLKSRSRGFYRRWGKLLSDAGIDSAEGQKAAQREAEKEEVRGHIKLHRLHARKYIIQKIELPLEAESWLLGLFNQPVAAKSSEASLQEVANAEAFTHKRFPTLWKEWCQSLRTAFQEGRNMRPLYWRSPEHVKSTLSLIYRFTSLQWKEGALIREVSRELGLGSKDLEKQRRGVEACLKQMFGRAMSLESVGIVLADSRSDLSGILTLHFPNGEVQVINKLRAIFSLSLDDLERAEYVTTPALRLLTVENSKTTLRRLASVNEDESTLLAACAFPTKALLRLLEMLPKELAVYHFGDTDPAGFHILSKLRETSKRAVQPFLMSRRPAPRKCPLTEYDQSILPRLLSDPLLSDVMTDVQLFKNSECKGDYEQEGLGLPDLKSWPFFSLAKEHAIHPSTCRRDG